VLRRVRPEGPQDLIDARCDIASWKGTINKNSQKKKTEDKKECFIYRNFLYFVRVKEIWIKKASQRWLKRPSRRFPEKAPEKGDCPLFSYRGK